MVETADKAISVKVPPTDLNKRVSCGFGLDLFQRETMSSIRARLGLGVFDLCQVEALAEACLRQRTAAVAVVQSWCSAGFDLEDVYLDGLVPTARLLGEWWCADRIDFAEVTIGVHCLQQILYEFSPQFLSQTDRKTNGYRAIFFSTPKSQHSFGTVMLCEFFRRSGWEVTSMAIDSDAVVLEELSRQWVDIAGFSICSDRGVEALKRLIVEARQASINPNMQLMIGGPMVELDPDLLATLGADLIGGDARESQKIAYQQVKRLHPAN